jgi:hypothetical protein
MKLNDDIKTDIQSFVYFLFKGSLSAKLIQRSGNYLDVLLTSPKLILNCFEVYTHSRQLKDDTSAIADVTNYIERVLDGFEPHLHEILKDNQRLANYWCDFLNLANKFCFNKLQKDGIIIDLKSLNGCGSDAVPIFAVWTNIIELDSDQKITNSDFVFHRLVQRFSVNRHGMFIPKFESWEIHQMLY